VALQNHGAADRGAAGADRIGRRAAQRTLGGEDRSGNWARKERGSRTPYVKHERVSPTIKPEFPFSVCGSSGIRFSLDWNKWAA
jgi:hypothetical protein